MRITEAGIAAIGATPVANATPTDTEGASIGTELADMAQEPGSAPLAVPAAPDALW